MVFIDPQVDVLSKQGKNWGAVGASVTENKTVENMLRIFKAAKSLRSLSRHTTFSRPIAYGLADEAHLPAMPASFSTTALPPWLLA
ncbi:hypothetical protein LMG28138_02447 [Pararobbsia alpina]|uniref:Uncharacterized protein n=1 Tax=Pararobbsia alpina TaxID=621374 RepID=A0A6S7BGZ5_9BURK|nr:hypothetical protein LMG28138_02447 [Pararobbsia alpina]